MTIEQIKDQDGMSKALAAPRNTIILVVFYSPYCGYCKRLMPFIEELCSQMPDMQFKKVDVTTSKDLMESNDINGVPDIFFYFNGNQIDRITGPNKEMLLNKITELKNQK